MAWSPHLVWALVLHVLVRKSFSYPYPNQLPMHPMRRQMVSSRSTQTWVPYPVMMPNFPPKMPMHDYPGSGSASFLRPPMPGAPPLMPSSSFLMPSVSSPPRPPAMPPTSKPPPARSNDRTSRHPPSRNKEEYRQHNLRQKNTFDYFEKDWGNQDEVKWRKRFNRLDDVPNDHEDRRTHSARRHFVRPTPRRHFADSEERIHRQRQRDFSQERPEDSQENHADSSYGRKNPMRRRKHESDEVDPRDSYYRRGHHNEYFDKEAPPSRLGRYLSFERNTMQPNRRRGQSHSYEKSNAKFDQKNSFNRHLRQEESKSHRMRGNAFNENSLNRHNSLNKESEEFQKLYNAEDDYTDKLKIKKSKLVKPTKMSEDDDSDELAWSYEDSLERKRLDKPSANKDKSETNTYARRNPKDKENLMITENSRSGEDFGKPSQRAEKKPFYDAKLHDSSPSPRNSGSREDFGKPKQRFEKKSFDDINVYDSSLSSANIESGEEFRKTKQSEKKSFYDTKLHDSLPSPENSGSGEDFRKSQEKMEKKSFDDVKLYDSSTTSSQLQPKSMETPSSPSSAEANKKDSWNWSSREIVVKDDEVSDTQNESGNYEAQNYDNVETEDKEETEIVDSGSDLLKIPNSSERSTVEKSYLEDSYKAEALTSNNNSTSSNK